jgi:FMN phosphatase YigB (HAD superfamily)
LDALGLAPAETLYVDDGSDDELEGAARCGLTPVLVATDLSNTNDAHRPNIINWLGARVSNRAELQIVLR